MFFTIVGSLNWGLIGFFNYNVVEAFFGYHNKWTNVTYCVVGVSAVLVALMVCCCKKQCDGAQSE